MFTDEKSRDPRETVADPSASQRQKIAARRILRAYATHRMAAIDHRSNGSQSGNDREAYERIEREANDHDAAILRYEQELAEFPDDPEGSGSSARITPSPVTSTAATRRATTDVTCSSASAASLRRTTTAPARSGQPPSSRSAL